MEPKESTTTPIGLLLEAPEFLEPDQNLFDQPPFSNAISALETRLGFNSDTSLSIVSAISWDHFNDRLTGKGVFPKETPTHGFERMSIEEQQKVLAVLARRVRNFSPTELTFPEGDKVVKIVVRELYQYPYWGHYVGVKVHGNEYKESGEPIHLRGMQVPVESYAKWVTDKLRREESLKMKGIEEVFSTEVSLPGRGISKKWAILKAAELVSEKR